MKNLKLISVLVLMVSSSIFVEAIREPSPEHSFDFGVSKPQDEKSTEDRKPDFEKPKHTFPFGFSKPQKRKPHQDRKPIEN
jgi:hypothetical protein